MKKSSRFQIQAFQVQFPALFAWPEPVRVGDECPSCQETYGFGFTWLPVDTRRSDSERAWLCRTCRVSPRPLLRVRAERTSPLVRDDRVEEVRVTHMTPELMEVRPRYEGATGDLVDLDDDDAYFLLADDLSLLGEVRQDRYVHHNEAHQDDEHFDGETLGEAIARLGCAEQVCYVLQRHVGYKIRDHHSVGGYSVTLYKVPKGWTISGWVAEQRRRAEVSIVAETAAIDEEGDR